MSLKQALKFCDASSVDEMLNVYTHFCGNKGFEKNLIELIAVKSLERSTTWILKHHLEQGFMLSDKSVSLLLKTFPHLEHWEARLHVLQSLPLIYISEADAAILWDQILMQIQDKNKLIRAWAYNGLHEIARQYPSYQHQVVEYLRQVNEDNEAASVLARIRKIVKAGNYQL